MVRFLGLLFDLQMSWNPRITFLNAACHCWLNLLKILAHLSWRADRCTLLTYSVLILSRLDYGNQLYSSASRFTLSILDRIHHHWLYLCLMAFCSLVCLCAEANIPSLSDTHIKKR